MSFLPVKEMIMFNKFFTKLVVAFGLLAFVLIFLGVNYVPRISAFSSAKQNAVDAAKNASPDYIERHLSAVAKPMIAAGPDWVERHTTKNNSSSDWVERHFEQGDR
jgi:cbb3-type cytochrome oxidase subunit 3